MAFEATVVSQPLSLAESRQSFYVTLYAITYSTMTLRHKLNSLKKTPSLIINMPVNNLSSSWQNYAIVDVSEGSYMTFNFRTYTNTD